MVNNKEILQIATTQLSLDYNFNIHDISNKNNIITENTLIDGRRVYDNRFGEAFAFDKNHPDVLAIAAIAQISSPARKRICHNSEIAISVRKDYWNIGVGSIMLKLLIDYAKSKGTIKNITLKVRASNTRAMYLYKKLGFKRVGSHKNYFNINGKYDDVILMEQYIW